MLGGRSQQRSADRHEERRRNAFPADIADYKAQVVIVQQKEIEQIATHFLGWDHGGMQLKILTLGKGREVGGKNRPLDQRRVLQFLIAQLLGLLDFGETRVLDANRSNVGQHREDIQVVFGEFVNESWSVEINESDDAVFGLQRHRQ